VDRFGRTIPHRDQPREPEIDQDARDIADLIIRIGDDPSPLERNVPGLANALLGDMARYRDHIVDTVFKCVLTLPQKTNIYGTLVGLMSVEVADLAEQVVKRVNTELIQAFKSFVALHSHDFTEVCVALLVSRNLTCLVGFLGLKLV
jgi:hypothetical protein